MKRPLTSRRFWLVLIGTVTACIVGAAANAGPVINAAHKQVRMGFSSPFLTDPFQAVLVNETVAQARQAGFKIVGTTNAQQDAAKQNSDIRNLIAAGANGLIINPTDSKAIAPALAYAASKHVPVISVDIGVSAGKLAMVVRSNNVGMGQTACMYLGQVLHGQGKVLMLEGDLLTANGLDRTTGFQSCMKSRFPKMQVIGKLTHWHADEATNVAQTVLSATPDLKAIYMESDSVMLPGILNVLKQAGKSAKVGQPGHIVLISIDGTHFALDKIRSGQLDALVSQPLNLYAKYGVQYLQDAVDGMTFKPGPTDHNSRIVMTPTGPEDLLPAPLVTKANVNLKSLWGNNTPS